MFFSYYKKTRKIIWIPVTVIKVSSVKNECISVIESNWKEVHSRSDAKCPLLSWAWMSELLSMANTNYVFVSVHKGEIPIGVGIIFLKRHGLKTVGYLNRTGNIKLDQPWIEYNDFLVDSTFENEARTSLIAHCFDTLSCDELVVGASLKATLASFSLYFKKTRVEWYSQTYQVDLTNFANKAEFLSSLSSNTRYQIHRAVREYNKSGAPLVEKATTTEQALAWLSDAAPHHIARWGDTRVGSGFENPHFVNFHKGLINSLFPKGKVDLLKISFGGQNIAYLYNFIVDKCAYFYLSANIYSNSMASAKHTKPGLVAHALAIEHYIKQGFHTYDFMGGESQYKRSFATQGEPISIVRFQRDNMYMRVENQLRVFKRALFSNAQNSFNDSRRLIVTGGALNTEPNTKGNHPQYSKALVCQIEINSGEKPICISQLDYRPSQKDNIRANNTNIIFKSASLYQNLLYVPTETEIKIIDIITMEEQETYSLACFNDLHHVIKHNDKLFIANTGLDAVTELNVITNEVNHHLALDQTLIRPLDNVDYRQIASTKPHLAHPNFCFELNNEIWVTRCDFMDAVAINDKNKRLFIGDGLVHDGVVSGKYVYFTTVEGRIKVYDKATLRMHADVDVKIIAPEFQGWFRGICPIGQGSVLIAMSKPRKSKRGLSSKQQSTLLLVDIYLKQIIQIWDLGELGLDAVFSVIEVSEK